MFLLVPLAIGFAVLRYRLWDIDALINRTLVYGLLTACVIGLYILVVALLGTLLSALGNLSISLLATGLVAVLFHPLRERLQQAVNRLMFGERDDPCSSRAWGVAWRRRSPADSVLPASFMLAAGIGGNRKDVDYQIDEIRKALPEAVVIETDEAQEFYRSLRDVELPDAAVKMQLSVLPRELPSCLGSFNSHFRAHVGSGVAQVAFDGGPDGADAAAIAAELRHAAARAHGHARVLSMNPALRGSIAFFDQPAEGAMKLMRALKTTFDPAGIFNPGCFVGGL